MDARDGASTFGVGGGITWESTPDGEYEECRLKARFLTHPRVEFDLLETMELKDGEYALLERHLARARDSGRYFGFQWNEAEVSRALDDTCKSHPAGRWRIRLTVGRNGEAHIDASPLGEQQTTPVAVKFASNYRNRETNQLLLLFRLLYQ